MFKKLASSAIAVTALALSAGPAQAIKILDLTLKENTGEHEIQVKFDRSKKNWTTATSKKVTFKLQWYLRVRSSTAINSNASKVKIKVVGSPGISGIYNLKENRSIPKRRNKYELHLLKTFKFPGNKLQLASKAVAACQKLYSQGKRPTKAYRTYIGKATSQVEADVFNYAIGFANDFEKKTATSDVYAVCEKGPDWKPPARAGIADNLRSKLARASQKPIKFPKSAHNLEENVKSIA